jgi:hypothetical protein
MLTKHKIGVSAGDWHASLQGAVHDGGDFGDYSATAARLRVDPKSFRSTLDLAPGCVLDLTSARDAISAIAPVWRSTERVDTFKAWVGVADEDAVADSPMARYWRLPASPWSGRSFRRAADLSPAEREDIETAGRAYIFGNSCAVASYREAIERVTGTFEVAVYAARSVRIAPGAMLRVSGAPAVLLFGELEIADGGQLVVQSVCRAAIGRLTKIAAAAAPR